MWVVVVGLLIHFLSLMMGVLMCFLMCFVMPDFCCSISDSFSSRSSSPSSPSSSPPSSCSSSSLTIQSTLYISKTRPGCMHEARNERRKAPTCNISFLTLGTSAKNCNANIAPTTPKLPRVMPLFVIKRFRQHVIFPGFVLVWRMKRWEGV